MTVDVGQHETAGDLRAVHSCLHCGYTLDQTRSSTPRGAGRARGLSASERLRQIRLDGVPVQLVYDPSPFPVGEFDAPPTGEAA